MTDLDYGIEPKPTNAPATVAVIAGLLACLPGTGLVSVPAGLLGLRSARKQNGFGRGPATFGLVLGIINLAWWGAVLAGALQTHLALKKAGPTIDATRQFVILVGDGNIAAARNFCVDGFDEQRLTDLHVEMAAVGTMQQPNPYYGGAVNGVSDIEIQAELKFDRGTRVLVTNWTSVDGKPKLMDFKLQTPPSTQPATAPANL
jgi:hypothetical protein